MATEQFTDRGGSDAEYAVYQALHRTGRREPRDFLFNPAGTGVSFLVAFPRTAIAVGREVNPLEAVASDIQFISENDALDDASSALRSVIGG